MEFQKDKQGGRSLGGEGTQVYVVSPPTTPGLHKAPVLYLVLAVSPLDLCEKKSVDIGRMALSVAIVTRQKNNLMDGRLRIERETVAD